jgi:hypothetical protein
MMRKRFRNLFDPLEDVIAFVASMLKAWKQPKGGLLLCRGRDRRAYLAF